MIRLASVALVLVIVAFPLMVLPAAPVTWLAGAALLVGIAGAVLPVVPLATAGGSLALIAYALALVIVRPAVDPVAAIAFGACLVLLLALAHFAARVDGAAVGASVLASRVREWALVVTTGVLAAGALTAAALWLAGAVRAAPPVVIAAAGVGVVLALVGLVSLVTARRDAMR
jgi:hypothetical protein